MPSHQHQTLSEMFRLRPELAAEVVSDVLGVALPHHESARVVAGEATVPSPAELHVDAVVLLSDDERPVGVVVVEIQLQPRDDKRWAWPLYLAALRRRWRCPALLLVVCVDDATARWAAAPIDVGNPGFRLRPLVLGPSAVPVIGDRDAAVAHPELTVLSVLAHADDDAAPPPDVIMAALGATVHELQAEYAFLVLAAVPERTREQLEELMASTEPSLYRRAMPRVWAEGEARGRAEGEARGRAEAYAAVLLRILDRRGVAVPDDVRARIVASTDLEQLETWTDRALGAATIEDVVGN